MSEIEQDAYVEDDGWTYSGSTHYYGVTNALAEADTRLLVRPDVSQTADLSQWATDLTSSESGAYEENSARVNTGNVQTLELEFEWDTSTSGVIYYNGNTAGTGYALRVAINGASGNLEVGNSDDGATQFNIGLPSWIDGTKGNTLVRVAIEPDPGTGNNRVEVSIHDQDAAATANWLFYDGVFSPGLFDDALEMSYGGQYNGADLSDDFTDTITYVRVSSTFHPAEKSKQDFVSEDSVFSGTGRQHCESISLPADLADDGEVCGPLMAWSQHAIARHARRTLSPLVNIQAINPPTFTDDLEDDFDDSEGNASPQGVWNVATGWQVWRGWQWDRPVPTNCSHVRVRVHVQLWDSLGGTPDKVEIRCYSSSGPAHLVWWAEKSYVVGERTTDDMATGTGDWVALGNLPLHTNGEGFTFLFLAVRHNEGTASSTNRAKIRAVTIEPVSYATDPNAGQGGNQGGWQWGG